MPPPGMSPLGALLDHDAVGIVVAHEASDPDDTTLDEVVVVLLVVQLARRQRLETSIKLRIIIHRRT